MSFLIIFLILLIIASISAIISFIYITQQRLRESPIATKYIVNHLSKFNKGHSFGRIVGKPEPVGNGRQLRRIRYRVNYIDEYGNEVIDYQTIIANNSFIIETPSKITVLPKSDVDIDFMEIESEKLKEHILKVRDFTILAEANKQSYDKFSEAFIRHYGGQVYQEIIESIKEHIKNRQDEDENNVHNKS